MRPAGRQNKGHCSLKCVRNLGMQKPLSPPPNVTDTALVFEGGAMRAVFSAAMVQALLEADVNFGWVCGNSAATSHVAYYIARDPERMRATFTTFPSDPNFGGFRTWMRGDGFFNAQYIYGAAGIPGHPMELDWNYFQRSPVQYRVSGFNARTGEAKHWGREDIHTPQDFFIRAQASSTLPFFMPPVEIDGDPWFDGAFGPTGGIPIDSAIEDGFKKFLVIQTRTRSYRKKPGHVDWGVRRMFRKYPALVDSIITRHDRYNEVREQIFELERQGRAYVFAPRSMRITNGDRNLRRLLSAYEAGLAQAREEMPAIKRFLGL